MQISTFQPKYNTNSRRTISKVLMPTILDLCATISKHKSMGAIIMAAVSPQHGSLFCTIQGGGEIIATNRTRNDSIKSRPMFLFLQAYKRNTLFRPIRVTFPNELLSRFKWLSREITKQQQQKYHNIFHLRLKQFLDIAETCSRDPDHDIMGFLG